LPEPGTGKVPGILFPLNLGGIPMYDSRFAGMTITGTNIKRDGSSRSWDGAECTGHFFRSRSDNALMIEVHESGERKHVNLTTFSGMVGEVEYVDGRKQVAELAA
jgi:hypothetical protein